MKRIFFLSISISLLIVVSLFLYSWYRLRSKLNLHVPQSKIEMPTGLISKTQYISGSNARKIAYWYFPVENAKAVVILIHGLSNPGGKSTMLVHAKYLHDVGCTTVLVDLGSFGESEGEKVTLGITEAQDMDAVYSKIRSFPENAHNKIGFFGISMGGVTALLAAGETGKADFVIASVPYADFNSLFHFQIKKAGFPPSLFYPFMKLAAAIELGRTYQSYTSRAVISHISVPLLLIGATHDEQVDGHDARALFDQAHEPKEYWEADSGHDVYGTYPNEFKEKVLHFLEKYTAKS